jgi:sugar-specific transcriptional regulator TrmB
MDQLLTELKHLGLSDKEAQVYLSSLELGPAPVQDISHKAKVNRATTYVMIEALSSRGLMSTFVKGKKRFYVPESPDRLLSILRIQQKEIEEKQTEFEKKLPLFLALFNTEGAKPQIRYLEGPEGIKTVRALFEAMDGEWLEILPLDDVNATKELMTHERDMHLKTLREKRTPHKVLVTMSEFDESKIVDAGVGEWRFLPANEFPIHGSIVIRQNYVFLFSYRSALLSVVITSQEIADAVRALFHLAWKGAEGYPSKKFS